MPESRRNRMFPLSSVLFPKGVMPLHIFEPRYLVMINEAIEAGDGFGVVLIERGPEVGGGDNRFGVGTMARIVRAGMLDDDRMAIVAIGGDRFDVVRWHQDDPYPCADVTPRAELASTAELDDVVKSAMRSWRRVAALASELGADVGTADLPLPDDPIDALWTLCAVSPLEQIDRQRLLETDDPGQLARLLLDGLDEKANSLEARLAGGFN